MTDSLKALIAQQAEDRIRKSLADASPGDASLPADLPAELSAELLDLIGRLDSTARDGLAAAARGDAFAAMPAAVECEDLAARLATVLAVVRSPDGPARWIAQRAEERAAEARRAEEERAAEARRAEEERLRRLEEERREREHQERLRLVAEERRKVVDFFKSRLGGEAPELPDDEQADVIRFDAGHLLVTARAGAGKTRALTYRALYLAEARGVDPNEIVLLAFNRKAAAEIEQRLDALAAPMPHVMTFHALARAMVAVHGDILTDDEDDQGFSRLREHLAGLIGELERTEPLFEVQLRELMLALAREVRDPQDGAVQTIDGAWVATAEHKLLWDFLFEHGFQPKHARGIVAPRGREKPVLTIETSDLTTVFSLAGTSDHGLTERRRGEPAFVQLARAGAREGREAVHARWRTDLKRLGLAVSPLSEDRLWQRVQGSLRREFLRATTTYVMRMRNQGFDTEERRRFLADHRQCGALERVFLSLAEQVHERYEALIASDRIIDFQELVLRAARSIEQGRTSWSRNRRSGDVRRLRHLMIDEFQDVSPLFMRLVNAIRAANPEIAVMGVGDDWQAINGFAGATTAYFEAFGGHFPGAGLLELRTNYRSGQRIVAAGNAVMDGQGNPALAARSDLGVTQLADVAQFLPVDGEQPAGSPRMAALRRLGQHHLLAGRTVALLSRTRQPAGFGAQWVEEFKRDLHPSVGELLTVTTVHRYKGKQADVVILVDAGARAFPIIDPHWWLFRVFGDTIESLVEAERRLLYVALTRAAETLVLVTDQSVDHGGLTPIIGDAARELAPVNWDAFPPPGPAVGVVCRIDVTNISGTWQEEGGTIPIKHLLQQQGYRFIKEPSPRWSRSAVVPDRDALTTLWPTVMEEPWVQEADRVLVTFSAEGRELVLVAIAEGAWTCIKDARWPPVARDASLPASRGSSERGPAGSRNADGRRRSTGTRIDTHLAGVTYPNSDGSSRQELIARMCRPGMPLVLRREPLNVHDPNAIAVLVGSTQIGFVPRDIARELSSKLADGARATARITAVTGGDGDYSLGVNVRIDLSPG